MISTLSYTLTQRKSKLDSLLTNNKSISPERKHQLYGALIEIDNILKILNDHKLIEVHEENHPEDVFLLKPVQEKGFFYSARQFFKDMF